MHDIVCLQEHWLQPCELNTLSLVHDEFLSWATSAVHTDNNLLTGRPYGGTAILYKWSFAKAINVVHTNQSRMTAVTVQTSVGLILLVNVYMPTDYGSYECYEEYVDLCAEIAVVFTESNATYLLVIGDFNCECNVSSRFYDILCSLFPITF